MPFPALVWLIGAQIALWFIGRALLPRPDKPQPSGLSDFRFPTVDPTRPLAAIFGTVKLAPSVSWFGDLGTFGFQINGQDAGFYYYLSLDLAVCQGPVDELLDLRFGDKSPGLTLLSHEAGYDRYHLNNPNLFGGNRQGGGIDGYLDVYYGVAHPAISAYLQEWASPDYPGNPHTCHLVMHGNPDPNFTGAYVGTSAYLPEITATVLCCPNSLGIAGGKHRWPLVGPSDPGYDSNPACILYELLVNPIWAAGIPSALIDPASFLAAGETLYSEKLGMSFALESAQEAVDYAAEILRTIDGDIYEDPETGLVTLRLLRDDYDHDALPLLDPSSVDEVELTPGGWDETSNVARISYISRLENFASRVAQWINSANVAKRGARVPVSIDFKGLSNAWAASLVAGRTLRKVSSQPNKFRITVNRLAWNLPPGAPFKLTWPPLGFEQAVCRVVIPRSGTLEDGRITLEAVRDAFDVSGAAYARPDPNEWNDPASPAIPAAAEQLIEAPYQLVNGPDRYALALAARDSSTLQGFEIWSDPAGGTDYAESGTAAGFHPTGLLVAAYPAETDAYDHTGFELESMLDLARLESCTDDELMHGVNLALIDEEIVAWRSISSWVTQTITYVYRGVFDTVPAAHALGARVWFFSAGPEARVNPSAPYLSDLTIAAKLRPYTLRSLLPLSQAARLTVVLASRALKPLPPGRVRLNNLAWPTSLSGDIELTWTHRHRVIQATAGMVVSQDAEDQATAPEGNYTIQVRVNTVLKRTVSELTGKSWTWTAAMQATDGATTGSAIAIRLIPVNGSLSGTYQQREFLIS